MVVMVVMLCIIGDYQTPFDTVWFWWNKVLHSQLHFREFNFLTPNKIYLVSFGKLWHFPFNFWMDGFNVAAKKFDSDRKISVILNRTLAASAVQNVRITGYFLIRSNWICRINGTFLIGSNVMLAPWDQVDLLKHWTIFKNFIQQDGTFVGS